VKPQTERSWEVPEDGWGVPLDAFPLTEPGETPKGTGNGSAGADRNARHGRSRRRLRRAGR
jgi:hypothetical protein